MTSLPPVLNLGVLAHVDAGKTSLTERLLHRAGVIAELGSVDRGTTTTDSLALERQRGITIRSAVASFAVPRPPSTGSGELLVTLVDTPGHPDFVAEVERALGVLDGVVLVVSAVEGVQARTRVLMRVVRRLAIPALLFVNKIDRTGADPARVLAEIRDELTDSAIGMVDVDGAGTAAARVTPRHGRRFDGRVGEVLAEHDDDLLAAYVDDAVPLDALATHLADRTARGVVHPVFAGSAVTGAGVDELVEGIATLLPAAAGDACGPLSGTVFAIERGPAGERVALVRLFSGTLRVRDRVPVGSPGRSGTGRVTAIEPAAPGAPAGELAAGHIGRVHGLARARVGDVLGDEPGTGWIRQFSAPSLESVAVPDDPADRGRLRVALGRIADQDPLLDLRQDERTGALALSLYGEVQQEVVAATLAAEDGIGVTFAPVTPICIERPTGTGAALEVIDTDGNPFLATVGLRVGPAPDGAGLVHRREVELGALPHAFTRAIEETVREALREGLAGWRVPDVAVTLTHTGYWARQSHSHGTFDKSMSSTAGDFRHLTRLVLMAALASAGTRVHEPVHRFLLDVPGDALTALWPVLAGLEAAPEAPREDGATVRLDGTIPAVHVRALQQQLAGLTGGIGVLETEFAGYRPATGTPPSRPRTEPDALDRAQYLLRVTRRAGVRG